MKHLENNTDSQNQVNEDQAAYTGFVNKSDDEKLREDVMRSPMEKLQSFTKMLRREALLNKAKILHN